MAKRIVCDIDDTEGATTRRFAFNGETYEIDLSPAWWQKMTDDLAPFVENATKVDADGAPVWRAGMRPHWVPSRGPYVPPAAGERWIIRNYCEKNGIPVNEKGQLPQVTVEWYRREIVGRP